VRRMGKAFKAESVIRRPIEDVWARLTDWANAGEWMRAARGAEYTTFGDEAHGVGSNIRFFRNGGFLVAEISAWDPPEILQLGTRSQMLGSTVETTHTYLLDHVTDSVTSVALETWCMVEGPAKVLTPIIEINRRISDRFQPTLLKDLMELDLVDTALP